MKAQPDEHCLTYPRNVTSMVTTIEKPTIQWLILGICSVEKPRHSQMWYNGWPKCAAVPLWWHASVHICKTTDACCDRSAASDFSGAPSSFWGALCCRYYSSPSPKIWPWRNKLSATSRWTIPLPSYHKTQWLDGITAMRWLILRSSSAVRDYCAL